MKQRIELLTALLNELPDLQTHEITAEYRKRYGDDDVSAATIRRDVRRARERNRVLAQAQGLHGRVEALEKALESKASHDDVRAWLMLYHEITGAILRMRESDKATQGARALLNDIFGYGEPAVDNYGRFNGFTFHRLWTKGYGWGLDLMVTLTTKDDGILASLGRVLDELKIEERFNERRTGRSEISQRRI